MSIEEKVEILDLLSDLFHRLKKISDNKFMECYAKDQVRNIVDNNLSVYEEPRQINPFDYSDVESGGIICTGLRYPHGFDIDSYMLSKPHCGMFFDENLSQFMMNMNGMILKGCIGKLVSKKSKKTMRCHDGHECKKECPYYHIHDIEFVRGKHPSEFSVCDKDYRNRRLMHDLLCAQVD